MKINNKSIMLVSFMLFSLFFGAGNLIVPPFLGQNAGDRTFVATIGFIITAVVLPVLGVIVIAKSNGLENLACRVNKKFAVFFTILIYISIGPGLGIPRAASVPFEMAVAPYLPQNTSIPLSMFIYSLVFFSLAILLCLNPSKLVERMGNYLTPILLILLVSLFVGFLIKGETMVAPAQPDYQNNTFLKGFLEGYITMDTIAALNFGLVIATTLKAYKNDEKTVMKSTIKAGVFAGIILALVYAMLTYIGMQSSGVYPIKDNGAWILREIVYQIFGDAGAILLAAIFTLACLTTCVGLIMSIAQYFSTIFPKISYEKFVVGITVFSFMICNQGLTTILSISVPVLNAIYPVSIMLILLGLLDKYISNNRYIYSLAIYSTALISVIYAVDNTTISLGVIETITNYIPLYNVGFGWITVSSIAVVISYLINILKKK